MCELRRTSCARRTVSRPTTDRSVREAEAIVHDSWIVQLVERCEELDAALRRAAACCQTAQQNLTAAQLSGEPEKIAVSRRDVAKAVRVVRNATLAWERTSHVLSIEAGFGPDTT
jgi:hypothetical protein